MGKIFSPEQILAMDYPLPGAHQRAALNFATEFGDKWQQNPDMPPLSGFVYGSTTGGRPDIRSDLDAALVVHGQMTPAIDQRITLGFQGIRQATNVPIDPLVFTSDRLSAGWHPLVDPLFAEHLCATASLDTPYRFGSPADALAPLRVYESGKEQLFVAKAAVADYLLAKQRSFRSAVIAHDDGSAPDYRTMQRALELPVSLGRKLMRLSALRYHAEAGAEEPDREADASMAMSGPEIIHGLYLIAESRRQPAVVSTIGQLYGMNQAYDNILHRVIEAPMRLPMYRDMVEKLYPRAITAASTLAVAAEQLT